MIRIQAQLNNLGMAPRKVRLVCDAIRGKRVPEADRILRFLTRRASGPVAKLLASAVANARHNFQIADGDHLLVREIRVDEGPSLKRIRPRAMGRAFAIRKRSSRITLVLEAAAPGRKTAKPEKAAIEIVSDDGSREQGDIMRTAGARPESERVKPAAKSPGFVRRVFRRKAI